MTIHKTHRLEKLKRRLSAWEYCRRCGLMTLKNEATAKEFRQVCRAESDK